MGSVITVAPVTNNLTPIPNIIEPYVIAINSPVIPISYKSWDYPELIGDLFENDNGQCVNYAKVLAEMDIYGNAIEWIDDINTYEPELKAVTVFNYGHLGVVTEIDYREYTITISERNYEGLWIVNERTLPWNDETIEGYII